MDSPYASLLVIPPTQRKKKKRIQKTGFSTDEIDRIISRVKSGLLRDKHNTYVVHKIFKPLVATAWGVLYVRTMA